MRDAIVFVLFALIALFSALSPHFFTQQNLTNIFVQQSYVIIAAVGLSFVMISGGMDLSIGYQISVVGVTTAALVKWVGLPFPVSLAAGLAMGTFLALCQQVSGGLADTRFWLVFACMGAVTSRGRLRFGERGNTATPTGAPA